MPCPDIIGGPDSFAIGVLAYSAIAAIAAKAGKAQAVIVIIMRTLLPLVAKATLIASNHGHPPSA